MNGPAGGGPCSATATRALRRRCHRPAQRLQRPRTGFGSVRVGLPCTSPARGMSVRHQRLHHSVGSGSAAKANGGVKLPQGVIGACLKSNGSSVGVQENPQQAWMLKADAPQPAVATIRPWPALSPSLSISEMLTKQVVSVSSSNLFTSCMKTCKLPVATPAVPNQVPAPEPQSLKSRKLHMLISGYVDAIRFSLKVYCQNY
ncbi:uncharacterized protein LOC111926628 [Cyanistes caeruleus]|uniref:uncharacterized protein LOC111926628 n=1 Tax=Cyanistes caeruleus TaxID=156563 RepID=UPI000CDA6DEE|nr:uncharacterized protein LOC111926628 [Cyanistes caeruleus]